METQPAADLGARVPGTSRITPMSAALGLLLVVLLAGLALGVADVWIALRSIHSLHRPHLSELRLDRAETGWPRHPGRQP
jgi:hypothetical protein